MGFLFFFMCFIFFHMFSLFFHIFSYWFVSYVFSQHEQQYSSFILFFFRAPFSRFQLHKNQAVVMDVGSGWTRMGLAGEERPSSVFPTVVGRVDLRTYDRVLGQVRYSSPPVRPLGQSPLVSLYVVINMEDTTAVTRKRNV